MNSINSLFVLVLLSTHWCTINAYVSHNECVNNYGCKHFGFAPQYPITESYNFNFDFNFKNIGRYEINIIFLSLVALYAAISTLYTVCTKKLTDDRVITLIVFTVTFLFLCKFVSLVR